MRKSESVDYCKDDDLIQILEAQDNKQGFIKDLLRNTHNTHKKEPGLMPRLCTNDTDMWR